MSHQTRRKRTAERLVDQSTDVLVVDDNVGIRTMMRFALEDAGYIVYEAPDGVEALDCVRVHARRLVVLLDLNLPRLDGWGVLQAVAETPLAKRHRFLLVTAQGEALPSALLNLLSRLHVTVIAKPCSLDRILEAVAGGTSRGAVRGGYATVSTL
jgi:CheY-like chemotaxis protein